MKKLILAALLLLPVPALAQPAELCPNLGRLGGAIMQARQSGVPKSRMLASVKPSDLYEVTISMIETAYGTYPNYPSAQKKAIAIASFSDQTEYMCLGASFN